MKKLTSAFFLLLLITACQKGIRWNIPSEGMLVKDAGGNCLPVTVAGNFLKNKFLNDSNFLIVTVTVNTIGNYTISSDSTNGYSFKATGSFNNTGNAAIKLAGAGTPLATGTDHFIIRYNTSFCEADVAVYADTIPAANYTLPGSPGKCMNDTIEGSYIQTVALDTSNKVTISVNVITPGRYSIFTNTVNGYSFSASGIFATAGAQTVTMAGKGLPENAGNDIFKVTAANSSCSFSITVVPVVKPPNNDYFPLTKGSFWVYDDISIPGDSIKRSINNDTVVNNTPYTIMNEVYSYTASSYYFLKNGLNYTEFGEAEKYTGSFQFKPPVYDTMPFLKEGLKNNQSWESKEFKGTATFGQLLFIKYAYTCINNNAAISLNGLGFKNVYIISVYPYIRSEAAVWGSTNEFYYYYYAKGIGLIYVEDGSGSYKYPKMKIRRWYIN